MMHRNYKAFMTLCFFLMSEFAMSDWVISDNDANIDDFFATWVLYQHPENKLLASVITDADCMGYQTIESALPKMHSYAQMKGLPFGMSKVKGKNPFPWVYRSFAVAMGQVPCLSQTPITEAPQEDGDVVYKDVLTKAMTEGYQVTVVATGPLTALAATLREHAYLANAIKRLIFMGGAVGDCAGNIDPKVVFNFVEGTKAEWNVFWDPEAVDFIFRHTTFPIILIPLNLTNHSNLTASFMSVLKEQSERGYALSTLAYQTYSLVDNLCSNPQEQGASTGSGDVSCYYLWDVTASIYQARPEFFAQAQEIRLSVQTKGKEQGVLYLDEKGRRVEAILDFAGDAGRRNFYQYFLDTLKK